MDRKLYEACTEAWDEAALSGDGWTEPLRLTESVFNATGVILHVLDRIDTTHTNMLLASRGVVPEAVEKLAAHYMPHDIRAACGSRAQPQDVVTDHHLGRLDEVDRSVIYAELFRPFDYGRFAAVRVEGARRFGIGEPSRIAFFNVLRANHSDSPDAEYQSCVLDMARTVQRSLRTATTLGALKAADAAKATGLDMAGFGAVFVRAPDAILEANVEARRHLQAQDAIACVHGRLSICDAASRAAFHAALTRVVSCGSKMETCALRRKERRPLGVMIVSLPSVRGAGAIDASRRADAIVLLFDPEVEAAGPTDLWRAMFGFTEAEAGVAQLFLNGLDLSEVADLRGVSIETVRTQFKRISAKVGADSQAAVILRLAQCAPRIGRD